MLSKLGLHQLDMSAPDGEATFEGGIFPAKDSSWVEIWQASDHMPAGVMLQLVVDDADAFAANARSNGLLVGEPTDAHGERIYFLQAPGGIPMSFQSKV